MQTSAVPTWGRLNYQSGKLDCLRAIDVYRKPVYTASVENVRIIYAYYFDVTLPSSIKTSVSEDLVRFNDPRVNRRRDL